MTVPMAELIGTVPIGLGVIVMAIRFVMGMTRLVDSIDRLSVSMESAAGTLEDHERRLIRAGL